MTNELKVDFTKTESLREGLIKVRTQKRHLDNLKEKVEDYQKRLEQLEKDCITAFIMGEKYQKQSSVLYIPDWMLGDE